jgi:hypothetical protein
MDFFGIEQEKNGAQQAVHQAAKICVAAKPCLQLVVDATSLKNSLIFSGINDFRS